jgi:hypothetical protein
LGSDYRESLVRSDYEVFLLSRIKKLHDARYLNERPLSGLQRIRRIITSDATAHRDRFEFAAGKLLSIKTVTRSGDAVAVDATIVPERCHDT